MLQVRLLGQFDVRAEGQRVLLPSRFGQSLFAFLILNAGTPFRREKLAGLLWPESPEDTARKSLRTELWRIRKALNAHPNLSANLIAAEELNIWFDPKGDYWLDVRALETTDDGRRTTDGAQDDGKLDVSRLLSAVKLYTGELLPGFYDEWVLLERERVQAVFERKMALLLDQLVREQQWNAVLEWGERWIALGQTPEPAYRALMIAHGARGDPAKVALVYDRCAEALRNELGVEPSGETRALLQEFTHGDKPTRPLLAPLSPVLIQPSGTVTFLFTDIEGSTRLLEDLGDEYAHLLADQRDLLRATAEKHNGHEVDTQGDAFFFAFFRAADAVTFAADAQRALNAHKWPRDTTLRVRMGLHTGEPMLARTGYVGMDVHRAARIGAAGHGGQVLLSHTTRALVENELPPGTHLDDLGEHKLKDLRYPVHIVQLTIEGMPADFPPLKTLGTGSEPPAPGEPPFKGLQFFDEADAGLFFGREAVVGKLVERLQTSPPTPLLQREGKEGSFLAVVVGASGSGKSSVVRAGLIPALRATNDDDASSRTPRAPGIMRDDASRRKTNQDWRVFVMTPTAHPLEALATVLTRDSESVTATATLLDDLARDSRSLQLFLRRGIGERSRGTHSQPLSPEPRTLLVIDQFEELFTLCHDEFEREAFIDNLLDAITVEPGQGTGRSQLLTLVVTIRADFYAHLAQYPELRDLVARHQEYIGPMNTEELRRAIEEPANKGGWEFEPGLVDLILRDVGDEPGALPLLSHALLETWKRRSGRTMTLKGYADAGGVRGAIAHTAESVYQALAPEQQAIARNIFLRLTELGEGTEDTRRRATMQELVPRAEHADAVRQVVTLLADARLITTSENGVEVAHEALIREWPQLRDWLNQDREGLRLHRQLTEAAQEWELLERDVSALYRGTRLAQARDYAALNPERLNDSERAFLAASEENEKREEREREEQRQRELLAKEQLLEAEKLRVEQGQAANRRLRRRAVFLASALVLAILLAGIALFLGDSANRNANVAAQSAQQAVHAQATAVSNADAAQKSEASAIKEKRIATARELAASSISNLDYDPERSILLALQAVTITYDADRTVLSEAEEALHRAIQASHVQLTLNDAVASVAFSPDGQRVATYSLDEKIRIWDAETGKALVALPFQPPRNSEFPLELAFSPDGGELAAIEGDHVNIWDARFGDKLFTLSGHVDEIFSLAYSPDGSRIATGGLDKTIKLWDSTSGKLLSTITGHGDVVKAVSFSPDGTKIASGSDDTTIRLWDAKSGNELLSFRDAAPYTSHLAFSPDGKRLAGAAGGGVGIWDVVTGEFINRFANVDAQVVAFSPDGSQLATGNFDGTVTLLDPATGNVLLRLPGHVGTVFDISFRSDGRQLATTSGDGTTKIWDVTADREELTFTHNGALLNRIMFSGDGSRIVIGDESGGIKVWDRKSGKELLELKGHTAGIYGLAFSPDEKKIATASADATAKIWDAVNGNVLLTISPNNGKLRGVKFTPDGLRLATAGRDGTLKVWDAANGSELYAAPNPNTILYAIAISPDGTRIATGYSDGILRMRDAATGTELWNIQAHNTPIWTLAYNPDGTSVATVSPEGTAKIWDAMTGKEERVLAGHTGSVWSVAFNKDGTRLTTGSSDLTAKVWDVATGKQLHSIPGHSQTIYGIAYSPDGTRIVTASSDGTARVYMLEIEDLVALAKARLTRTWRQDECQKYLHVEQCPE